MVGVDIDMSEVRSYAKDLAGVPAELSRHALPVLKKGAQNIKTTMQEDLRASNNDGFRFVAGTVSYDDPVAAAGGWETEIGPDKDRGGALANIAYFGTYKGGGTVRDPREALEEEIPAFEREVDKLIDGLFR